MEKKRSKKLQIRESEKNNTSQNGITPIFIHRKFIS